MLRRILSYYILYLGITLILAGGVMASILSSAGAKSQLREELFYTVELTIAATDPEQIQALPAQQSDPQHPAYRRLREQYLKLQAPLQKKNIRWVYAMKETGGDVHFLVDSVPTDDPGHSEPGVLYEQPPAAVYKVIQNQQWQFVGPYDDEYGKYYSVFAPIRAASGEIVGILGADIEYDRFQAVVRRSLLLPFISSASALLLFVILYFYVRHRRLAERMKSEFISIASHQLKTPITALNWIVESLIKDKHIKGDEDVKEQIGELRDITKHMNDLVTGLLNVSRVETGRLAVRVEQADLAALAANVIKETAPLARKKQQSIHLDVPATLPRVSVDPMLIREVYKNLLTNAMKYSPEKSEIRVIITSAGKSILSRVVDRGYGIPQGEQRRVFQKFFRASNIASVEPDGNGLGLYLAKQVIDLSGGKIWFESKEGVGTTFYFTLPKTGSQPRRGEKSLA